MVTTIATFTIEADPSTYVIVCCLISLAWAFIQFMIISQTK
jgi:hypothetical protein